ncbi:MAG: MBL fold metallo-hydrolase [Candidatus Saccharimonadales bacterium]
MILTKYLHACFTVEKDGKLIVVDPGAFSTDFITPGNVLAVIVTHAHGDHFDHDQLEAIIDKNPDAIIIGDDSITSKIDVFETHTVKAGDHMVVGQFELDFTGGEHALIHESIPRATNVGVIINELLYYPGDSFVSPGMAIDTLAIPAGAPWMKTGEAMDFIKAVKPRFAFPTHDVLLSESGKAIADQMLSTIAKSNDIEYRRLEEPIEI